MNRSFSRVFMSEACQEDCLPVFLRLKQNEIIDSGVKMTLILNFIRPNLMHYAAFVRISRLFPDKFTPENAAE